MASAGKHVGTMAMIQTQLSPHQRADEEFDNSSVSLGKSGTVAIIGGFTRRTALSHILTRVAAVSGGSFRPGDIHYVRQSLIVVYTCLWQYPDPPGAAGGEDFSELIK